MIDGGRSRDISSDYPQVKDGVRGMYFINAVVKSLASHEKWISLLDEKQ